MQAESKINCHKYELDRLLNTVQHWNIPNPDKKKIPEFINDYKIGKVTGRVNNNPAALYRNLHFLKAGLENLESHTPKGCEDFLHNMLADKVKHAKGNFAMRTKRDTFTMLARYLDWRYPNKNVSAPLKITIKLPEKDHRTISDDEIARMIERCNLLSHKYFIAVLNASGARAEEFHNIRYSDITFPTGKEQFLKIRLRDEYSKTKGRTIQLYDKKVVPIVKQYVKQRLGEGMRPEDPVFHLSYNHMKKWVRKHSLKTISKPVNYHLFRHTTATRLSSKMNRQQMCIYFGWKFSSTMPDTYIDRNGVQMEDVTDTFEKTNYEELESKVDAQEVLIKKLVQKLGLWESADMVSDEVFDKTFSPPSSTSSRSD